MIMSIGIRNRIFCVGFEAAANETTNVANTDPIIVCVTQRQ